MSEFLARQKPVVLLILDGFGVAPDGEGNAISRAEMPFYRELLRTYPSMPLLASGESVGLPWGAMGNSEVGHLTIGTGRILFQLLPRIDRDIESGAFNHNPVFEELFDQVKKGSGRLHLVGLVSSGKVHASDLHLHALIRLAASKGIKEIFIHAIMDGRDTVYNSGVDFLTTLQSVLKEVGVGRVASVSGRFYAMDRDHRAERTQKAFEAIFRGEGPRASDPIEALKASYAQEIFDEHMVPTVICEGDTPVGPVQDGDGLLFFNFRPDRMRQLVRASTLPVFDEFPRGALSANLAFVTMGEYEPGLPVSVAFPPEVVSDSLAACLSQAGLTQLHIAETEKYAHVTFFFNGKKEDPYPGETRVLIPSPPVTSYAETPEMSLELLTDRLLKDIKEGASDFLVANFANPDMVAHTGNREATEKANAAVDEALARIVPAVLAKDGMVFVTADHGNAEEVKNIRTGERDTEHSTNPVPFIAIAKKFEGVSGAGADVSLTPPVGLLTDVAPTILNALGLPIPSGMTGTPLL